MILAKANEASLIANLYIPSNLGLYISRIAIPGARASSLDLCESV